MRERSIGATCPHSRPVDIFRTILLSRRRVSENIHVVHGETRGFRFRILPVIYLEIRIVKKRGTDAQCGRARKRSRASACDHVRSNARATPGKYVNPRARALPFAAKWQSRRHDFRSVVLATILRVFVPCKRRSTFPSVISEVYTPK